MVRLSREGLREPLLSLLKFDSEHPAYAASCVLSVASIHSRYSILLLIIIYTLSVKRHVSVNAAVCLIFAHSVVIIAVIPELGYN